MGDGVVFVLWYVLWFGVVLLGFWVSFDMVGVIGWGVIVWIVVVVVIIILLFLVIVLWFGKLCLFGFLSGGFVVICGVFVVLVISLILFKLEECEQDLVFIVIVVIVLLIVVMIVYFILVDWLGLDV